MTSTAIDHYFIIAASIGVPLGVALAFVWARKIFKPLVAWLERQRHISIDGVAMRSTVMMVPGLVAMVLCCVPLLYCGYLRKQHAYCVDVVRANHGIARDDPDLVERCGRFDYAELVALADDDSAVP